MIASRERQVSPSVLEVEGDRRGPDSWVGWAFVVASAACLLAAGNWWNTWRSVRATDAGSLYDDQAEQRMLFWLTWAAIAALAAGVVWAVRRWGRRGVDGDATTNGSGAPATHSAAAAGAGVVVDVPPATHLDWKAPTAPRLLHWTDRLRWALGVGWLVLLLVGVLAGTRMSTFDDARAAVASGAVPEVTVAGALEAGDTGWTTQEVLWREGWTRHRAEVRWSGASVGSDVGDLSGQSSGPDDVPVLGRDVADVLRDAQPGLVVHRTDTWSLSSTSFLGWYLPAPQVFGPVLLAGALLLLFLVLNVPPTWRLTRWAWFWVGVTPVGAVLFALFAGPTPGLPRPRHPGERIGGVVAFVFSLVAGSLLHWGPR